MCTQAVSKVLFLFIVVVAIDSTAGQTASLSLSSGSGAPGATVTLNVSLATNGTLPAAVQWDLLYSTSDLSPGAGTFYATGAAATLAGKQATCGTPTSGDIRCVVAGFNSTAIANGVLATVTLQIAPTTTSTSTQVTLSNLLASDGSSTPQLVPIASPGAATITIAQSSGGGPPALSTLSCTPGSLAPPGSATCTVSLTGAVSNSTVVKLSSANALLVSVPASVTLTSGSSKTFTAAAPSAVSTITPVLLTASLGVNSRNFSLGLTPAAGTQPSVSSVVCSPSTVSGGTQTSCTVYLTSVAPSGGTLVQLSSSNANAFPPQSVTVPAGSSSAGFSVSTAVVTSVQTSAVLATASGGPQSTTLTIQPVSGPSTLASVTCNPSTVIPGGSSTCTVWLTSGAPSGGITVAFSSSSPQVSLPGSILIPTGGTSANVTATASTGASGGNVTILASANKVVQSTVLTVALAGAQAGLTCAPATVQTPGASSCTLRLQSAAAFDTLVLLHSSNPSLTVPPSITIATGNVSATFTATAAAVSANTTALLTAANQNASQSLTLLARVTTNVTATSISCSPATLTAGGTSACQIGLSGPVPGGVSIQLSSSSTQISVPPFVQPAAGSTSAPFIAISSLIDHDERAQFNANLGSSSAQTTLALVGIKPVGLACAPKTLQSGSPSNCQVTLNSGQAATPITLALASGDPHVKVPVSVSSRAGQATIGFQAITMVVRSNQTIPLSATYKGITVQDKVTLTPQAPVLTVPARQTVLPGKSLTFTISASDPAGLPVTLSIAGLPSNASFNPNSGTFTWYPATTQAGLYIVHFTGTNAAGISTTQDVVLEVTSSTPVISMLTNSASYVQEGCSPGAVATLLGTGFVKAGAKSAASGPLPTEVNGLRVKVNGTYLPVLYAAESVANFQCPQLAPGDSVSLTIESDTGTSSSLASQMQFATPGIFTLDGSGKGQGAILIANTAKIAMTPAAGIPGQPATPQGWISIYATGLGATDVAVQEGAPAPSKPLARVKAPVDVLVDGQTAKVTFAGLAPGYAGLYVVNAQVPAAVLPGNAVSVQIAVHLPGGTVALSNLVTIAVAAAGN